jgi:beta-phosphoglucomutase-like phosphatase (HAD superfamily)
MVGARGFEPPTSPANIDRIRAVLNLHRSCTKMEIMDRRTVHHFVQFSGFFAGGELAPMLKGVFGIWTIEESYSKFFWTIGNRKEEMVIKTLKTEGVKVYEGSVAQVPPSPGRIKTAVVSSSKNTLAVLKADSIDGLFDVRVDGYVGENQKLPGKPAPDTYPHVAALLDASPQRAVEVEEVLCGVQAGRNDSFGLVIGVDRKSHADALRENEGGF